MSEFLDYLEHRHVYVSSMALFLSQPNFTVPIHTDAGIGDYVKINTVFGGAGTHARSSVGMSALPLGAPVEIEIVVEVRP